MSMRRTRSADFPIRQNLVLLLVYDKENLRKGWFEIRRFVALIRADQRQSCFWIAISVPIQDAAVELDGAPLSHGGKTILPKANCVVLRSVWIV